MNTYRNDCENPKCGKRFESVRRWQKYCNDSCRNEALNYWKAAERISEQWHGDDGHIKEFVHWACEAPDHVCQPLDHFVAIHRYPQIAWLWE